MVVVFANNQTLVTTHGNTVTVFTDPVPMGSNDRLAPQSNVHSIVKTGSGTPTLIYTAQVSNDGGANFLDTSLTDTLTTAAVDSAVGTVNGALVRFKYAFSIAASSAGDMAAVCFDLHVNFDHV